MSGERGGRTKVEIGGSELVHCRKLKRSELDGMKWSEQRRTMDNLHAKLWSVFSHTYEHMARNLYTTLMVRE